MFNIKEYKITVFGMGYVGLPLAIEFGKKTNVVGFDLNKSRIIKLKNKIDSNNELSKQDIKKAKYLNFSYNINDLEKSNIYIIAVPTPINKRKIPDLSNIKLACDIVSKILKKKDIVIFESTVYPGLTEEFCVPILENNSGLKYNIDFFCGYSPERINPGDRLNTITNIIKITSGSNKKISKIIDQLYKTIIKKGTYLAPSIKVAEAAKVIENAQRDINIAFVNEISLIFDKLNINTHDVLKAASTKWNFLNFKPGLVGGHCIGVDPYYLAHKSKLQGYNPVFISSGRNINDNYFKFISKKILSLTTDRFNKKKINILIMGATFKENCSDYRNSKSISLYNDLKRKKINIEIYDPLIDKKTFFKNTKIKLITNLKSKYYHSVIIAVSHKIFLKMGQNKIRKSLIENGIFFDFKNIFKNNKKNFYI